MRRDAEQAVVYEGAPAAAERPAWLLGGSALVLLGLVWEAVAIRWVPALFLPAPTAVLAEAGRMAWSGELGRHVGVSLARVGIGFGLGAGVGTVLGLALGSSRALWAIGNPVIAATYPIPKIALLPLMILWLGIGETPKVVMIALGPGSAS
jgi:NitT/TauT family transport system permease protein